jgi:O-antigen/teichoic acid export membrane protein
MKPPTTASERHEADIRHAARSGAVQALTVLAQGVIALTQIAFNRLFGDTIYGAYRTVMAAIEMAARGGAAGADKSMLRYVAAARAAGDEEGVRRALGTGLRLCLAVSGTFSLLIFLGADPLIHAWLRLRAAMGGSVAGEEARAPAFRALAPVPMLWASLWVLIQASLAARVTRANFWVRGLFEPTALLVAGVAAWYLGTGLRGLAVAQSLAAVATVLLALTLVRGVFRPAERRRVLSAPGVRGFARFSAYMGLAELMNATLQQVHILIVSTFVGLEATAVYGAAELITRIVANMRYAFDSIIAGMMSESLQLGERDRLQHNLRMVTRWVTTTAVPLAAIVISLRTELLVGIFSKPSYAAGATALAVLTLAHLCNAILGLTGWALVAGGRSSLVLLNNFLGVVFNVAAGLFFTPRYGLVGATIGVFGSMLIVQGTAIIEVAIWQRVHPFAPALLKPLLAGALSFATMTVLHRVVPPGWVRVTAVVVAGVLVYGGVLLALGLPPEEKRIAERLTARLR